MDLVQEMLETAIEFVQTKETVEQEKAHEAHEILQDTLNEERALLHAYSKAHQNALQADEVLEKEFHHDDSSEARHNNNNNKATSAQERREMTTQSEISHQVESYVQDRLAHVQDRETRVAMDEIEALKSFQDLKKMESDLKTTLEQVRVNNLGQQGSNIP